jgi:hypothetical protein
MQVLTQTDSVLIAETEKNSKVRLGYLNLAFSWQDWAKGFIWNMGNWSGTLELDGMQLNLNCKRAEF